MKLLLGRPAKLPYNKEWPYKRDRQFRDLRMTAGVQRSLERKQRFTRLSRIADSQRQGIEVRKTFRDKQIYLRRERALRTYDGRLA